MGQVRYKSWVKVTQPCGRKPPLSHGGGWRPWGGWRCYVHSLKCYSSISLFGWRRGCTVAERDVVQAKPYKLGLLIWDLVNFNLIPNLPISFNSTHNYLMKSKFHAISLSPNLIASPKFEHLLQFLPWFFICSIGPQTTIELLIFFNLASDFNNFSPRSHELFTSWFLSHEILQLDP
jgi:hypothetical protein